MKRIIILISFSSFLFNLVFSQEKEKYTDLIDEAKQLYNCREYYNSGLKYSEAFIVFGNDIKTYDRYYAARSWTLAEQYDSAFIQLFEIAENNNFTNLLYINTEQDLNTLHPDKRWNELIQIITLNKKKEEENLDKTLVAMFDTIYVEQLRIIEESQKIWNKYGYWRSEEMEEFWDNKFKKDSVRTAEIMKVVDERGWLGTNIIGEQGSDILFDIITRSDLEIQEKYLPMLREAAIKGNADLHDLAYLEDKIALQKNNKQIYGTHLRKNFENDQFYILPVEDPDNIDNRRKALGLESLQDYVSCRGIVWNVEEHKKQMQEAGN